MNHKAIYEPYIVNLTIEANDTQTVDSYCCKISSYNATTALEWAITKMMEERKFSYFTDFKVLATSVVLLTQ